MCLLATDLIEIQGKIFPAFEIPDDRMQMLTCINQRSENMANKKSPQLA